MRRHPCLHHSGPFTPKPLFIPDQRYTLTHTAARSRRPLIRTKSGTCERHDLSSHAAKTTGSRGGFTLHHYPTPNPNRILVGTWSSLRYSCICRTLPAPAFTSSGRPGSGETSIQLNGPMSARTWQPAGGLSRGVNSRVIHGKPAGGSQLSPKP
eukprot:1771754-Pyramimonas_sp.AAC.1